MEDHSTVGAVAPAFHTRRYGTDTQNDCGPDETCGACSSDDLRFYRTIKSRVQFECADCGATIELPEDAVTVRQVAGDRA